MKAKINALLIKAIELLYKDNDFSIEIVKTKSEMHGDWSSNIAMIVAKKKGENPKELAQKIIKLIPSEDWLEKVEIAGPGFLNFFLTKQGNLNYLKKFIKRSKIIFSF